MVNPLQNHSSILTHNVTNAAIASNANATLAGRAYGGIAPHIVQATVEKVDNGFILRMGQEGHIAKVKICKDMEELKNMFVATMVEYQLEK